MQPVHLQFFVKRHPQGVGTVTRIGPPAQRIYQNKCKISDIVIGLGDAIYSGVFSEAYIDAKIEPYVKQFLGINPEDKINP